MRSWWRPPLLFLFYALVDLALFFGFPTESKAYACISCSTGCDVGSNPCSSASPPCNGYTGWCASSGCCNFTCTDCPGGCGGCGGTWLNWSECNGGYRTRDCSCDSNIYQIDYCAPPPTNPPGSPAPTNPPPPPPSCSITLAASYSVSAGNVISISPVVSSVVESVDSVDFVITNSGIATVCASGTGPCSAGSGSYTDSATAFNADLTGVAAGSTILTVTGNMPTVGITCQDTATVTVSAPNAWWQVSGGDIIAGNASGTGSVTSTIPAACILPSCNPVLIKDNPTSYSGVPSAGGSSIALGSGTYSASNWRVTSGPFLGTEGYNYNYFENKVPSAVTPTLLTGPTIAPTALESGGAEYPVGSGYFWYRYAGAQGNLTISGGDGSVDLASRKIILFVEGANIALGTKVTVTDGLGALYLFAAQNIDIAATVGDAVATTPTPDIEAILFAEQQVRTGTTGANNDLQLAIRGGVVGLGASGGVVGVNDGILFQRNVLNDTLYPGDLVTYAPDLVLNWPVSLTRRTLQWREVAP